MLAPPRSLATAAVAVLALAATAAPADAAAGPSTTTVTLSATSSVYGQSVTATAQVSTLAGPAEGDVLFAVDGTAVKANLGASGTASVVLPRSAVGAHEVVATFVPQVAVRQEASSSAPQPWLVTAAPSHLVLRVTGRGARIASAVRVHLDGDYGTVPTGEVSVAVRRADGGRTRVVRGRLSASGDAVAGLGRLAGGRYRAVVTYAGDAQHLAGKRVETFSVRR